MGGRYTATTQGFQGGDSVVLAVTYPWAPASSYLSSQSVADSRCNPHATPRSSYSRRSPSRRFFLCRSALPCLVLHRHCCLSVPCSRGFSCLSAQFRSPRCVLWPLKFIQLGARASILYRVCYDPPPMSTPAREGETIEGYRTTCGRVRRTTCGNRNNRPPCRYLPS